MATEVSLSKM